MTLEAAIRLRRTPGLRQGVILGVVLGACVLVNQESAVMAAAAGRRGACCPGWSATRRTARLRSLGRWRRGRRRDRGQPAAHRHGPAGRRGRRERSARPSWPATTTPTAPACPACSRPRPRWATSGCTGWPSIYSYRVPDEAVPTFGLVLSVLAVCGLAAAWRRRSAWWLALLWLGGAALALGSTLVIGSRVYVPLADDLERRPGVPADALHLAGAPAGPVRAAGGRPAGPARAGRRGAAGRARGGLARRHARPLLAVVAAARRSWRRAGPGPRPAG